MTNHFLSEEKLITAKSKHELEQKVSNQKQRWKVKEKRAKEQMSIRQLKEETEAKTEATLKLIAQYQSLLKTSLAYQHQLNWDKLYCPIQFQDPKPCLDEFIELANVPKENKFIELIFPPVRKRRLEKEMEATRCYEESYAAYQLRKKLSLNEQQEKNRTIVELKKGYEYVIPEKVEDEDMREAFHELRTMFSAELPPKEMLVTLEASESDDSEDTTQAEDEN